MLPQYANIHYALHAVVNASRLQCKRPDLWGDRPDLLARECLWATGVRFRAPGELMCLVSFVLRSSNYGDSCDAKPNREGRWSRNTLAVVIVAMSIPVMAAIRRTLVSCDSAVMTLAISTNIAASITSAHSALIRTSLCPTVGFSDILRDDDSSLVARAMSRSGIRCARKWHDTRRCKCSSNGHTC